MTILRITCSPRGSASASHRLSQHIVDRLLRSRGGHGLPVVEIDANQLPHVDPAYAAALSSPIDPPADVCAHGSLRRSDELIQALREATYVVIATPMHNYTVPSSLKTWIDHVVRVRHTFHITPQGKVGTLADRPVFVTIASGGEFSGEPARQPDFLTPYLTAVLATIGLKDVRFFPAEGTARSPELAAAAHARAEARIAQEMARAA